MSIFKSKSKPATSTQTSHVEIPVWARDPLKRALGRAETLSQEAYTPYDPEARVAPLSQDELAAFDLIRQNAGKYMPYMDTAIEGQENIFNRILGGVQGADIEARMNPYLQGVLDRNLTEAQRAYDIQSQNLGDLAESAGAYGGSRLAVQANEMQDSYLDRLEGIQKQGIYDAWNQALGQWNLENQMGMQGAGQLANMAGVGQGQLSNQAAMLQTAGQQQRMVDQGIADATYEEFMRQQQFPYQQINFLTGTALPASGLYTGQGTTTGTSTPATQSGSTFGKILGTGLSIAGTFGFSDERLKENKKQVGELNDGTPVYAYNYKGEDNTQLGVMAQDVEGDMPDAVGSMFGYKTVDYDKIADRNSYALGSAVKNPFLRDVLNRAGDRISSIWDGGAAMEQQAKLDTILGKDLQRSNPTTPQDIFGGLIEKGGEKEQLGGLMEKLGVGFKEDGLFGISNEQWGNISDALGGGFENDAPKATTPPPTLSRFGSPSSPSFNPIVPGGDPIQGIKGLFVDPRRKFQEGGFVLEGNSSDDLFGYSVEELKSMGHSGIVDPELQYQSDVQKAADNPELLNSVDIIEEFVAPETKEEAPDYSGVMKEVLDFASGPESNDNYDTAYSSSGKNYGATSKTINEILEDAPNRVKSFGGSAIGRYQMMPDTIKDEMKYMGLTGEEQFTPELQDQMMINRLLRMRKGEDWASGNLDDISFASHLSREFGSFPHPDTGKTYYEGTKNKALKSTEDVLNFLKELRSSGYACGGMVKDKHKYAQGSSVYDLFGANADDLFGPKFSSSRLDFLMGEYDDEKRQKKADTAARRNRVNAVTKELLVNSPKNALLDALKNTADWREENMKRSEKAYRDTEGSRLRRLGAYAGESLKDVPLDQLPLVYEAGKIKDAAKYLLEDPYAKEKFGPEKPLDLKLVEEKGKTDQGVTVEKKKPTREQLKQQATERQATKEKIDPVEERYGGVNIPMLMAGIRMLKSDGDIWEQMGSGFEGYALGKEAVYQTRKDAAKAELDAQKTKAEIEELLAKSEYYRAGGGKSGGYTTAQAIDDRNAAIEQAEKILANSPDFGTLSDDERTQRVLALAERIYAHNRGQLYTAPVNTVDPRIAAKMDTFNKTQE